MWSCGESTIFFFFSGKLFVCLSKQEQQQNFGRFFLCMEKKNSIEFKLSYFPPHFCKPSKKVKLQNGGGESKSLLGEAQSQMQCGGDPTNNDNNNNALLINFLLSSDAETFVTKHRLSIRVGTQTCQKKTCARRVHIPTGLPLCVPPLLVGAMDRCQKRNSTASLPSSSSFQKGPFHC